MKQKPLVLALIVLGIVSLSCGLPSFLARAPEATPAPVKTLRPTFTPMPSATNTVPPSPTPVPTDTPVSTATSTDTPVPPTDTPEPPTDTPEPTMPVSPTDTLEAPVSTATPTTAPPTATKTPRPTKVSPSPTPQSKPKHVVGSHGVSGLVVARDKTTFAVGEQAWFTYEALNHTNDPVGFERLGIKASNGQFNTSWVNPDVIQPSVPFKHDDALTFNSPGTYKVFLAICFDHCGEADADWEEFPKGAATITVK